MPSRSGTTSGAATLEYLVGVAKEWTRARFAAAESSRFVFIAHRFEPAEAGFSRVALAAGCAEARGPCDAVTRVPTPTVWAHGTVVTVLADTAADTIAFEQEVIEILAMDGEGCWPRPPR